jgi:alkylation response protein AidB-like acyl-CoA dehydrogenase
VNFAFTAEQEELRATARAFLAEHAKPEHVRAALESELGHDPSLWKRVGAELGWTAVAIPEAAGGLGLSWVEVVALQEVLGEALFCGPYLATVGLAATALQASGEGAQQAAWLGRIAGEGASAALANGARSALANGAQSALANGARSALANRAGAHVRRDGGDYVLDGAVRHVVDGHCAELLVVAAEGERGPSLFALPADARGLERVQLPTVDRTRRLAELRFGGVRLPASARLGAEGGAGPALERALALGAVALAAEQVGVAQRSLDLAVAYAKERVQFGRPIGSFQAIKHKCADMMVKLEAARSAVYWAGCVAADPEAKDLTLAASAAKAAASDAAFFCAGNALQIFGGVGFTAEYDVQLYFKRARASAALLGDPAWHRERVAQRLGL